MNDEQMKTPSGIEEGVSKEEIEQFLNDMEDFEPIVKFLLVIR